MDKKRNHGTVTSKEGGDRFMTAYGKDTSDVCGTGAEERGGKIGGSATDLGHSISGAKANQTPSR